MSAVPALTSAGTDDTASRVPVPPSRVYGAVQPSCSKVERFIDGINLLQHLPGVADAYRAVTGDQLCSGVRYFAAPVLDLFTGAPASEEAPMPATERAEPAEVGTSAKVAAASTPAMVAESGLDAPRDLLRYLKPEMPTMTEHAVETPAPDMVAGAPIDLLRWLRPAIAESSPEPLGVVDDPRSPLEIAGDMAQSRSASDAGWLAVPPVGLAEAAAHPSNHLPLAVLEVLQDRHRSLIGHERT